MQSLDLDKTEKIDRWASYEFNKMPWTCKAYW